MNKGKYLASYDDLQSHTYVELQDLQLRSLLTFDLEKRALETPQTIGQYREIGDYEYPVDLSKGYENMIFSSSDPDHYNKQKTCHYIMTQKLKPNFDFCTSRGALGDIQVDKDVKLVAIKFKNCIYLKSHYETNDEQKRQSFQFKLRQHVFVDTPGGYPKTDVPVDQRKQIYANFSATLGKFRLLYSAEMVGVDNAEPLGNLNDPEVLQQLRFSMVKVISKRYKNYDWRKNFRAQSYLFQAHLTGIKQLRLAYFDKDGIVSERIETFSIAQLHKFQQHELKLQARLQLLHNFLGDVHFIMAGEDSPYTAYVFRIRNNCVRFNRHVGNNEYSFLDKEYINYINDLYKV